MFSKIVRRNLSQTCKLNKKYLITGGRGQLGRGLADELIARNHQVILTDINAATAEDVAKGYDRNLNVLDKEKFAQAVEEHNPDSILHLPALLSASCEADLDLAEEVNVTSALTAWKLAKKHNCQVFIPSSIGAFGPNSPLENVPDKCIQDPQSFYGVFKVMVENLANYSRVLHGVDFRCLRYPGIISPVAQPGGGTTDYAVDIFHEIVGRGKTSFSSFLQADARLPMMLESDCIKSTCDFLALDKAEIDRIDKQTGVYNLTGCSFTPQEISDEIKKQFGDFEMKYEVDPARQAIAESWPKVFNADGIYKDFGIKSEVDSTERLTEYMIQHTPRQ